MGKNRGGKKWSRKRKADEKSLKSDKPRRDKNGVGSYNIVQYSNAKFESYYSLIGLHDTKYNPSTCQFEQCTTDEEKHAERNLFMETTSTILPASFRVDRSLDPMIQSTVLEELQEFVGKEMELEIELPQRSVVFGGMKNILDNGKDVVAENDNGEEVVEAEEEEVKGTTTNDAKQSESEEKPNTKNGEEKEKRTKKNDYQPIIVKKTIAPAKPIPFISSGSTTLGFQLSIDRRTLRRNKSLEPLHDWLKIQTDCGHITRQETVSMIPPVVLNAKEGMSILDMCAAPGSKTCQLLEVVGGLKPTTTTTNNNEEQAELEPTGYVVANDADAKRAYMLVNQLRRMNSPSVFVTSCDGQYFPILDAKSDRGTINEGMFDRVLCDVPCSGDGTVRKNPGIWKRWNQLGSLALHPLQLSIALRGARLTKVGGYMVYSTCSLNPMENESVVAELLRIANGSLVLEDPRHRMEGLLARPGWSHWRVLRESKNRTRKAMKDIRKKHNAKMQEKKKEFEEKMMTNNNNNDDGECPPPPKEKKEKEEEDDDNDEGEEGKKEDKFAPSPYDTIPYVPPATWDEASLSERTTSLGFVEYASHADVEEEWKRRVRASCFPPTPEEAKQFELHKSLRCLPQDMDTGGFYVALLKKVKPLSKDATERMKALARESRGGVEVDAHLKKKEDDDNGKESEDVTMTTESSAAASAGEEKEEEDDEPIQKAPTGKVGVHHNHGKDKTKQSTDLGKEDFVAMDPTLWPDIVEEYGLDASTFPKHQFMVRAAGEAKVLYFISKSIKENLIDYGMQDRVTVINSGLKGFERCSIQGSNTYRLSQEGIHYIVPHMKKRVVIANMDDFYTCNQTGFIKFDQFSTAFVKDVEALSQGSFVVTLKGYERDISKKMFLVMWRRSNCVNCFVTKVEMDALKSKMRALGYVAKEKEDKAADVCPKEDEMDVTL